MADIRLRTVPRGIQCVVNRISRITKDEYDDLRERLESFTSLSHLNIKHPTSFQHQRSNHGPAPLDLHPPRTFLAADATSSLDVVSLVLK
jgi:hypothetical protein